MDPGRAPDGDDIAALEAVWGREASATAPGPPRPDLDALLDPEPGDDAEIGRSRRPRPAVLLGVALVLVGLVVAAAVLRGDGDDGADQPAVRSTTVPSGGREEVGEAAWTAPVVCRPAPDAGSAPICPVATDDERAYVLVGEGDVSVVQAHALADGTVAWDVEFPEGAATVRRLPSAVLVLGVGPDWLTVALDPATGTERWRAPGTFVGPIGPDHVLLDELVGAETEERGAMSVLDAETGQVVLAREGTPAGLYVHPCGEAGLALVRQDGRLIAMGVPDGAERWSVPVQEPLDFFHPVRCDETTVAYIDGGDLHLLDAGTGAEIGSTAVAPAISEVPVVEDRVAVLAVVARTVVVGSPDGARGFRADADLDQLWRVRCRACGSDFPTGPAGDDVVLLIEDHAVVRSGADGTSGPRLELSGGEQMLDDDTVLAWGAGELVLARTTDLGRSVVLDAPDVRQAAVSDSYLVVSTVDEVRAYPREG